MIRFMRKFLFFGGYIMSFITIFLIAVGLAMDAFAVSVSNGVAVHNFGKRHAFKLGMYFGVFQFIMPILGWFLGVSVKEYVEAFDHWIAFILLLVIGANMIIESVKEGSQESTVCRKTADEFLTLRCLIFQAVATSIDALAIGISFAILNINIIYASAVIGVVAFIISFAGGILGKRLGSILKQRAEIFGGVILILIGLKILFEHVFSK